MYRRARYGSILAPSTGRYAFGLPFLSASVSSFCSPMAIWNRSDPGNRKRRRLPTSGHAPLKPKHRSPCDQGRWLCYDRRALRFHRSLGTRRDATRAAKQLRSAFDARISIIPGSTPRWTHTGRVCRKSIAGAPRWG